jgi:uncharacterized membrane protein
MSGHKRRKYRGNQGAESHDEHARQERANRDVNLNETERQFSLMGGTVLAVCGLLRGSVSGLALAAIGGGLIYRGVTGHCHLYEALDYSSAEDGEDKRITSQHHGQKTQHHEQEAQTTS